MAKRVILAVAGAGKTYYICRSISPAKKHLILAYTRENIGNIKRELIAAYGSIPELTNVMTFDSFVYRYLLCPYEPSILRHFEQIDFVRKGITTKDPPPMRITRNGRTFPNPFYVSKDKLKHYISSSGHYYCSTMTELIMQVKKGRDSLIKRAALSINRFYDQVSIDEFQDFREHDYDLINSLAKYIDNILLVGDYYQHSVSALNNSGKPFKNRTRDIDYQEYKQILITNRYTVDDASLCLSRRCSASVCDFIRTKLGINIGSHNSNDGAVIWVNENHEAILEDDAITKLVYQNSSIYSFNTINWSYSKGNTIDCVCVILTDSFEKMDDDTFTLHGIPQSTVNKLYVAMTRTKGDLYLIKNSDFRILKSRYRK